MKNNFLGDALILCAVGAILMGLFEKEGTFLMTLVTLVLGIVYAVSHTAPDESAKEAMVDALFAASSAIHALEDQEGNMPEKTGEFEALQDACAAVDRALDLAMEVV